MKVTVKWNKNFISNCFISVQMVTAGLGVPQGYVLEALLFFYNSPNNSVSDLLIILVDDTSMGISAPYGYT